MQLNGISIITKISYIITHSLSCMFGYSKWPLAAFLKFDSNLKSDTRIEFRHLKIPHSHVSHLHILINSALEPFVVYLNMAAGGHLGL